MSSKSLNAIIVDDENLARRRVINLLKDIEKIEVIYECKNGVEAIEKINHNKPDIIFLDIQMKDMSGFEVIQKIEPNINPLIIFITAYDEFALKAFDFFAFDYLLKPYKDERFYISVKKAIENLENMIEDGFNERLSSLIKYIENPHISLTHFKEVKLPIKTGSKISFIDKSSVKYIKASGYYAEIFTKQKKFLLRESLSNLVNQFNPSNFIRIHRSTIININFMEEVKHSSYGEIDVKMNDDSLFRVSKSYKKIFLSKIGV